MTLRSQERADCSVLATATALDIGYTEAHALLTSLGRKPGRRFSFQRIYPQLGLELRPDLALRQLDKILPEMQAGRFIVRITGHFFAVVNGIVYNNLTTNPRCRTKMVYEVVARPAVS